jgi:hypothetical protein
MESVKKIIALQKEIEEKMKSMANEGLAEVWKEFFERHPEIKALSFSGSLPSWNDGEACTFHMNEDFFVSENEEEIKEALEAETSLDNYEASYADGDKKLNKDLEAIGKISEEVFQTAFGDNFLTFVTPTKVYSWETESY